MVRNPASDIAWNVLIRWIRRRTTWFCDVTGDVVLFCSGKFPECCGCWNRSKCKLLFVVTSAIMTMNRNDAGTVIWYQIRSVVAWSKFMSDYLISFLRDLLVTVSSNLRMEAIPYCMDSHSYSPLKDVKGYVRLTFDQINWYRQQSAAHTARNGSHCRHLFFHIPVPEQWSCFPTKNAILHRNPHGKPVPETEYGHVCCMKESGDDGYVRGTWPRQWLCGDVERILLAYMVVSQAEIQNIIIRRNGARIIVFDEGAFHILDSSERGRSTKWIKSLIPQVLSKTTGVLTITLLHVAEAGILNGLWNRRCNVDNSPGRYSCSIPG